MTISRAITYIEPIFENFGKDFRDPIVKKGVDGLLGLFVATAYGDKLQVYARGNAISHTDALGRARELKIYGKCIGGGTIVYRESERSVHVRESSRHFGTIPDTLLIDYFSFFQYNVQSKMHEKWYNEEAKKWLHRHGVSFRK